MPGADDRIEVAGDAKSLRRAFLIWSVRHYCELVGAGGERTQDASCFREESLTRIEMGKDYVSDGLRIDFDA